MHLKAKQCTNELTDELGINLKMFYKCIIRIHRPQDSEIKTKYFLASGCKSLIGNKGLLKIYRGMLLRAKAEEEEDGKHCSVTSMGKDREVGQRGWHD